MIVIAGVAFAVDVARQLEWVGLTSDHVCADLARVRGGDREALLAECLDGAEDAACEAAWREYVSTLAAASV